MAEREASDEGAAVTPSYTEELAEPTRLARPEGYGPGMLAIPCHRDLPVQSAEAIFAMAHEGLPLGSAVVWSYGPSTIAANRNRLVKTLLRNPRIQDLDWICMCDSDALPKRNTILKLLGRNVDVVGALYCIREPPYKFGFGAPLDPVPEPMLLEGLLEVEWVGTHCLLIRRRVLERLKEPWFDHFGPGYGEDVYFCRKARRAGFHVFVDLDVEVGHMAWTQITKETALAYGKSGLYRVSPKTPRAKGPRLAAAGD